MAVAEKIREIEELKKHAGALAETQKKIEELLMGVQKQVLAMVRNKRLPSDNLGGISEKIKTLNISYEDAVTMMKAIEMEDSAVDDLITSLKDFSMKIIKIERGKYGLGGQESRSVNALAALKARINELSKFSPKEKSGLIGIIDDIIDTFQRKVRGANQIKIGISRLGNHQDNFKGFVKKASGAVEKGAIDDVRKNINRAIMIREGESVIIGEVYALMSQMITQGRAIGDYCVALTRI